MSFRITEVWLFVAVDPDDGEEGLPAFQGPDGMIVPMVATDTVRRDLLRQLAATSAVEHGLTIRELHFTSYTQIQSWSPPHDVPMGKVPPR